MIGSSFRFIAHRVSELSKLKHALRTKDRSSNFNFKRVRKVLDTYTLAFEVYEESMERCLNTNFESPAYRLFVSSYLAERVITIPKHILQMCYSNIKTAHADLAGMNRSLFESAVNFLFIQNSPERLSAFIVQSAKHELKIQKAMNRWTKVEDSKIRKRSEKQRDIKDKTTEATVQDIARSLGYASAEKVPRYPTIRDRCEYLGEFWEFQYDSKYRGLSAWQHGDATRMIASQLLSAANESERERPVFETLVQLAWTNDIYHQIALRIAQECDTSADIQTQIDNANNAGLIQLSEQLGEAIEHFHG